MCGILLQHVWVCIMTTWFDHEPWCVIRLACTCSTVKVYLELIAVFCDSCQLSSEACILLVKMLLLMLCTQCCCLRLLLHPITCTLQVCNLKATKQCTFRTASQDAAPPKALLMQIQLKHTCCISQQWHLPCKLMKEMKRSYYAMLVHSSSPNC